MRLKFLTILILACPVWAQDKAVVPFPEGFRSWRHVKSFVIGPEHKNFQRRGGIHHFYANDLAVEGYRTGKFPDGSVVVEEIVFAREGEGDAKGMLIEGERRSLDVMVKDSRLYPATGGWGFESFQGDSPAGLLPSAMQVMCYSCHQKQKGRDHVFSAIRK